MRHPVRALFAVLAVAVTLGWVVGEADARIGGGSSSGSRGSRTFAAPPATRTAPTTTQPMQRTLTQPAQPGAAGAARPAAAGGSWFNRPGLLGGLAAGFLGAGLFGLLFGHGMFGGLGGLASMLGLIVQVGLIAIVAMLIWRWFQRRNQPAMASGSIKVNGARKKKRPGRSAPATCRATL